MTIPSDLLAEQAISFDDAAKTGYPQGPIHETTVFRHALDGVGADEDGEKIKLESYVAGGRRFTTKEAILRFVAKTTAAANAEFQEAATEPGEAIE